MTPFMVGMVVMAIGISFGANAGYAINPARDFGPRMFAWIAGWGSQAMPGNYGNVNDYFWIPIVGPLIGAALACPIYDFGIRDILKARRPPEPGVCGVRARRCRTGRPWPTRTSCASRLHDGRAGCNIRLGLALQRRSPDRAGDAIHASTAAPASRRPARPWLGRG